MPAGGPIEIVDLSPRRFGAVRRRSTLDASTDMATAAPVWPRILSKNVPFGLPLLVFHDAAGPELFEEPGVEIDLGFELYADLDDPIVTMSTSPGGRAVRLDRRRRSRAARNVREQRFVRAVVRDVPMKAVYGDETSHLKIRDIIGQFLTKNVFP